MGWGEREVCHLLRRLKPTLQGEGNGYRKLLSGYRFYKSNSVYWRSTSAYVCVGGRSCIERLGLQMELRKNLINYFEWYHLQTSGWRWRRRALKMKEFWGWVVWKNWSPEATSSITVVATAHYSPNCWLVDSHCARVDAGGRFWQGR